MSYKKRGPSPEADIAQNRLQGIKQVEPAFDFGNGLTSNAYELLIKAVITDIQTYNGLLTTADGLGTQIDTEEQKLKDFSSRILNAIGSKYGYDSIEYEKAGGIRTSDYKRNSKTTTTSTTK